MNAATMELARRNLMAFTLATKPGYEAGWVHREICARLMRFMLDARAGKSPRMIITMPPRHGKSELVSRRFPAWCFGIWPDCNIIAASYGDNLARRMNKDVQRIMDSPEYVEIFPDIRLTKSKRDGSIRTSEFFEIPGHSGSYRSTGVGGGITGMGADILNIDDPIKDRKSADSPTIREGVMDWYASTAYTRLSPGGGVLVTQTRWHENDLAGRLMEAQTQEGMDRWTVVNYPAIAEMDEPHRKKGDALHPERFPIDALMRIRANVGEYEWSALYQQRPTPRGGGVFKREWLRTWTRATLPAVFDTMVQSWDFTFKDAQNSDNVSGQVWMKSGGNFYLMDCVAEKMDFVSQQRAMKAMTLKWPEAYGKVVEDKANGSAIISSLGSAIPGIVPYTPRGSKTARAYAVSPLFEAGNVFIPPMDTEHPWVADYVAEITSFPNAPHDDRVDATTQALDYLCAGSGRGVLGIL